MALHCNEMAGRVKHFLATAVWALVIVTPAVAAAPATEPLQFAVETIDAERWSLDDARGHWVVVNFWATWCAPCVIEMPEIDAFTRTNEAVRVIGLAWQDATAGEIRNFLRQHPVSYPIALVDPLRRVSPFPTPHALPTTYLIDPQGRLAQTFVGPVTTENLRRATAGGRPQP